MNVDDQESLNPLNKALSRHLTRRLDPQLGRATAKFAAVAMQDPQIAQIPAAPGGKSQPRRGFWIATSSTGAVAAAVVIGFAIFTHQMNRRPSHLGNRPGTQPAQMAKADDVPMERTVFWRTLDEGTVFLDAATPARQLRRQQVEEVAWTDPSSGQRKMSYSIPQEEVMLVAYDKY